MNESYSFDQMLADIEGDRAEAGLDPKTGTSDPWAEYATGDPVERGLAAGKSQPRDFYLYSNKATEYVVELWSRYTGVPARSAARKNLWRCCAKLLTQYPDVKAIENAVNSLARKGRFQMGCDMYSLRTLVENEVAKMQADASKMDDFIAKLEEEEPEPAAVPTCPKCGRPTWRPGEDCQWH